MASPASQVTHSEVRTAELDALLACVGIGGESSTPISRLVNISADGRQLSEDDIGGSRGGLPPTLPHDALSPFPRLSPPLSNHLSGTPTQHAGDAAATPRCASVASSISFKSAADRFEVDAAAEFLTPRSERASPSDMASQPFFPENSAAIESAARSRASPSSSVPKHAPAFLRSPDEGLIKIEALPLTDVLPDLPCPEVVDLVDDVPPSPNLPAEQQTPQPASTPLLPTQPLLDEEEGWTRPATRSAAKPKFVVLSDDESDGESEQGSETRASRLPRAMYAPSSSSEDSSTASSDASSGDFSPSDAASDADSLSPPPRPSAPRRAPTPPPEMPHATFRKRREDLAKELYAALNASIFDSRLPADLPIRWNSRLITTAGLTHFKRAGTGVVKTAEASSSLSGAQRASLPAPFRLASIELSARVLDAESKLRSTLCHEMCHAAAWVLDGVSKPPHGPHWRAWAQRAQRIDPGLTVSTCHSYDIFFAHRWQCTSADCLASYGRHSASIDVRRHACGKCRAPLQYLGRFQRDGTPAKARGPTPFGLFVKQRFATVKATMTPGSKHADVMRALSQEWALRGKPSSSDDASLVESLAARLKTEAGDGLIPAVPPAGAAPNSTSLLLQSIVDLSLSD